MHILNTVYYRHGPVERSGSAVELRTVDYENPGSNPGCGVKTLGKFFHSTLLQFIQLNKNEYLAIDSGGYVYEQPSRINCSIWLALYNNLPFFFTNQRILAKTTKSCRTTQTPGR